MKQSQQKTRTRSRSLQTQQLAAVRGGSDGVIHAQIVVGGRGLGAHDNGVIHTQD